MGTYVGTTTLHNGRGVVMDYRYIDGASVMPSDAIVHTWRKAD
jgi:branched-chain amino acid transport system substrate-binding protein